MPLLRRRKKRKQISPKLDRKSTQDKHESRKGQDRKTEIKRKTQNRVVSD